MKKESLFTLIVYVMMVAIAIFVGVNIIAPAFITMAITGIDQYVYATITIFFAFLINVVLLEIGHILGALAGGYRIQTVNVLGLAFVFSPQGLSLRLQPYEGLTGETVVIPKAKKLRPKLFLWGGLIVYVFEMILAFIIGYGFFDQNQWGRYASVVVIAVGGMLMIYNFMPFKLDTVTDGYKIATLTTAKGNEAYEELQRIEKMYKLGNNPKPFKVFKELNNLNVQIYFHKIYQAMVDEAYDEAKVDLKLLSESPRLGDTLQQKVFVLQTYIAMIEKKSKASASYFYELSSKQRKYLSNDNHMSTLSTYLYVAGLIEDSYSEATYTFERQVVSIQKIQESGRKAAEAILFDRMLKLVKKKHPTWQF